MFEKESSQQQNLDINELVIQLYNDFSSEISEHLWPWETARWYEFVFCILTTIGEPEVLTTNSRRLTEIFCELGLLEIETLAKVDLSESTDPLLITLETSLQNAGFSQEKASSAVQTIHEAAISIQEKYGGKVQNYFNKYGSYMLDQIEEDFGFSQFDNARQALSIWLQNTLNMPIPASNPIADKACESLGVTYDALVEAANQQDINIALLDDALRAFWGSKSAEVESKLYVSK